MRWISVSKTILTALTAVMFLHSEATEAKTPVSIELVLAVDISHSVDEVEYQMMMSGMANIFRTPEIINTIGQHNGVAVTLFQWSSDVDHQNMVPWHVLTDPPSVLSFANKIENVKRDPNYLLTGIGKAIDFGIRLITENEFAGSQLIIDVSGDGRNNEGPLPSTPRQLAHTLGIVINGLPIISYPDYTMYDLEAYYLEEIILGTGAFVEVADDYNDFARAFHRKLRRELSTYVSEGVTTPLLPTQQAYVQQSVRPIR
jgi:hypothetical protein